jgi:predicted nucleic acid-binding Zn ribbon protein
VAWDETLHQDVVEMFEPPNLWEWLAGGNPLDVGDMGSFLVITPPKRSASDPCKGCGKPFENRRKGWLRAYCSDECRKTHHNREQSLARRASKRNVAPVTCEECRGTFLPRSSGGKPQRFCSEKCGRKARQRRAA